MSQELEFALSVFLQSAADLQKALDNEYKRRRANLINAGFSRKTGLIQGSIDESVRGFLTVSKASSEAKRLVISAMSIWVPKKEEPKRYLVSK